MTDTKHGWVTPRADGARARCGGPDVCPTCQTEQMHEHMLTGCFGSALAAPGAPSRGVTGDTARYRAIRAVLTDTQNGLSAMLAAADAVGLLDDQTPTQEQFDAIADQIIAAQNQCEETAPETSPITVTVEPEPGGMTLGERIAHVGGRTNAQGYTEFGSPMAVNALIQHVLRDIDWTRQDDDGAYQARYRLPGGQWSSWGHVVCGVKGHEQELRYFPIKRRPAPAAGDALTDAARDVLAERQRQISAEGWTPEHDDKNTAEQLALAAVCYALPQGDYTIPEPPEFWPWDVAWWKPGDRRRELIKAGALVLAEIERLDRAAVAAQQGKGGEA